MTDYEAMRIHVFRDQQVEERVHAPLRDLRGDPGHSAGGGSQSDMLDDGDPLVHGPRRRGLLPGHLPQPHHPGDPGAHAPGSLGEHPGPQVDDPGLRGLHLRPEPRRVQGRGAGLASRRTWPSTSSTRAASEGMPVYAMTAAVRPRPRHPGHRRRLHREPARPAEGAESHRRRQRRLHGQEHQRPHQGHPAHRRRVAQLLPDRLQPDQRRPRRQVPQDPGEGRRARTSRCARARATTRRCDGKKREEAEARPRPGPPGRPRLAVRGRRHPDAHDLLRLRRDAARQGQRARGHRRGRPRASPSRRRRAASRTRWSSCWWWPTARPASSSATTRRST